jgi:hypothetical protein
MSTTIDTPTTGGPDEYIEALDEPRRRDIRRLHELIRGIAPELEPRAESGGLAYGTYRFRYADGRYGEFARIGLASRKRYISLYVTATVGGRYVPEMYVDRLPGADIGRACVRFRRLTDVDEEVLKELIRDGATTEEHLHLR